MDKKTSRVTLQFIGALAFLKLALHLVINAFMSYGIFRDEFYYIACSNHLALGYVDQPPLSIYLLACSREIFGDSLFAIRILPALAGGLSVFFTGLIVRKLGGGKQAIILAGLSVLLAPIQLAMFSVYSMNSYDILLWTVMAYVIILFIQQEKPKWWILLGLLMGLGLMNKIGILWFGFGFFIALLATPLRSHLKTKWPYLSGMLAFLLFTPFIIWNVLNDFAHLEFIRNASSLKYAGISAKDFILGQVLIQNPFAVFVWLAGLYYFFFHREGKNYRILGIIYAVAFFILVINGHSKPEYLGPAYPMLFAGGAVLMEKVYNRINLRWLKFVLPVLIVSSGICLAPLTVPVLPVQTFIKYQNFIKINTNTKNLEGKEQSQLPQFYADRFGWENMAATVSEVFRSLSDEEQKKTVIFGQNYGEAGSMEYYREKYGLPTVISTHNNYWFWGYGDESAEIYILLGGDEAEHQSHFGQ
ncbi:glycosyltransferase family 39 protein, partial [Acidobacteriota bacterium]